MKIIINKKDLKLIKDLVEDEYYDLVRHCSQCVNRLHSSELSEDHRKFYQTEYDRSSTQALYFEKLLRKLGD